MTTKIWCTVYTYIKHIYKTIERNKNIEIIACASLIEQVYAIAAIEISVDECYITVWI